MHEHACRNIVVIRIATWFWTNWSVFFSDIILCLFILCLLCFQPFHVVKFLSTINFYLSYMFPTFNAYAYNTIIDFQRPRITQSPVSITVAAGQTAKLKCEASGKPAPNFQWLKDGCDVAGSAGVTITTGNRHSTLTINNIQESHAGQYICMCRAFKFFSCCDDISDNATITVAGESRVHVCLVWANLSTLSSPSTPMLLPCWHSSNTHDGRAQHGSKPWKSCKNIRPCPKTLTAWWQFSCRSFQF